MSICQQKSYCRQQTWIPGNKQKQYKMDPDKLKRIKKDLVVKGEDYPLENMYRGVGYLGVLWGDWWMDFWQGMFLLDETRDWSFSSSSLLWLGVFVGWLEGVLDQKWCVLVKRSCWTNEGLSPWHCIFSLLYWSAITYGVHCFDPITPLSSWIIMVFPSDFSPEVRLTTFLDKTKKYWHIPN